MAAEVAAVQQIGVGDHLCSLHSTEEEHRALITPFLRQGLERNERVLYIVDGHTAEEILSYLRRDGLDVQQYVDRGQLILLTSRESYMRDGAFDPDAMLDLLRETTQQALDDGYTALRISGEMTWALRGLPGSERLLEYEAKLNKFFPGSRSLAICQYDRRQFPPEMLLNVLEAHPKSIVGTTVYDNFYYIPPGDRLGLDPHEVKLRHWTQNLEERRRLDEDRAARERAEREVGRLQELNDFKTRLLDTAAHELRTPLTPIQLQMELLRHRAKGQQFPELDVLQRNLDRLQDLVEDVLEAARLQAGRLPMAPRQVDAGKLVRDAAEDFGPAAAQAGVVLRVEAAPNLPAVADPQRVHQVLVNLLSNALKFTPSGGAIVLRAVPAGNHVRVEVADSGIGIDPKDLPRLFQPFTQLGTAPRQGSGMGLYISRGIVEQHRGRMWAESAGLGKGSTFAFTLPVA